MKVSRVLLPTLKFVGCDRRVVGHFVNIVYSRSDIEGNRYYWEDNRRIRDSQDDKFQENFTLKSRNCVI